MFNFQSLNNFVHLSVKSLRNFYLKNWYYHQSHFRVVFFSTSPRSIISPASSIHNTRPFTTNFLIGWFSFPLIGRWRKLYTDRTTCQLAQDIFWDCTLLTKHTFDTYNCLKKIWVRIYMYIATEHTILTINSHITAHEKYANLEWMNLISHHPENVDDFILALL